MALAAVLVSLLLGALGTVVVAGREFVVSAIDLVALGIGVTGLVAAVRTRRLRVDVAMAGYVAMLAVIVLQVVTSDAPLQVVGGASRFVVPTLLLFGLTQLWAVDGGIAGAAGGWGLGVEPRIEPALRLGRWTFMWTALLAAFAVVLSVWIVVLVALGLTDPLNDTLYEVKNQIEMPLGASNYVAAFVLVPAVVLFGMGVVHRRSLIPAALAATAVVATLSRGAIAGLVAGFLLVVVLHRWPRWGVRAAVAGVGAVVAASVALGIVGTDLSVSASTVASRLVLLEASWDAFVANPLLGVDLNNILSVTQDLPQPHVNAHNLVLHALVTTGLLGTAAYLSLWVLLGVRLVRGIRGGAPRAVALAGGAFALFVHAAAEALAYTRAVEALLAVLLALAATPRDVREFGPGADRGASPPREATPAAPSG